MNNFKSWCDENPLFFHFQQKKCLIFWYCFLNDAIIVGSVWLPRPGFCWFQHFESVTKHCASYQHERCQFGTAQSHFFLFSAAELVKISAIKFRKSELQVCQKGAEMIAQLNLDGGFRSACKSCRHRTTQKSSSIFVLNTTSICQQ